MAALDQTTVGAVSTLRETEPWGPVEQPSYLNGVVALDTGLGPDALLAGLLAIERSLGRDRDREIRWGPRRIDLDLLLVDDLVVSTPALELPHPRLHERRFVLEPLAELEPGLLVPGRGSVSELLAALHSAP
jgi:2-amino-4-hydroxy-6-hydroxymethyldihydropteridine diphosphokinase